MSGICGIVRFDGRAIPPNTAEVMAATAPHRAQDGTRTWTSPTVQLAHQATHLAPESALNQPFIRDDRWVLVGAIRLDARQELIRRLNVATTPSPSDAALVMEAFRRWGSGCLEHLYGDFAFVIVDTHSHDVLLARDPLGSRSLYYRIEPGNRLVFGTELSQVLAAPGVPMKPFEPAIAAHLAGPYGRHEWSFFDGIHPLPAACRLQITTQGTSRVDRYWDPKPAVTTRYRKEQEYAEHFRDVFMTAVGDRMRTSGPLGIQLSGGMDSGSTASAAGAIAGRRGSSSESIRTYSYAFAELTASDERVVSDHIVEAFGFTGVPVFVDDLWPLANYPAHGPVLDDPFVTAYTAASDAIRSAARDDGVRLLLVPEKGDEVIGTPWVVDYLRLLDARQPGQMLREFRSDAAAIDDAVVRAAYRDVLRPLAGRLKHLRSARNVASERQSEFPPWIRGDFAERCDLPGLIRESIHRRALDPGASAARHRAILSLSGQRWATDLERRHARAGLGYSDPFADRRVVEYVLSIPQAVVNRPHDQSKRLLRRAMAGVMPEPALQLAQKLSPDSLFRRGVYDRGRPAILDLVSDMRAAELGFVDHAEARRQVAAWTGEGGPPPHDPWWLITLEWWLRRHW